MISALHRFPRAVASSRVTPIAWMGFRLPRAPGCHLLASAKGNCQTDRGARPHPSVANGEVIDYFGRCVEPAAQADAILYTWTTVAFMAGSHGRSITAWDFFCSKTAATG